MICVVAMWVSILLLGYVAFFGEKTIDGASASRWLKIPGTQTTFQPSSFAYIFLIAYLCRHLARNVEEKTKSWRYLFWTFAPILLVFLLVAKDNGSTALMILFVSMIVLVMGQLGWKYIFGFMGITGAVVGIFALIMLNTDWIKTNRVDTWKSRVDTYIGNKKGGEGAEDLSLSKNYQITQATAALVHGGLKGTGPGKSAMKQSLSQSFSDFIFAIIVEEYGIWGPAILLVLYFWIFVRMMVIANKFPNFFGVLLVLSIAVVMFVQIVVNIGVSLSLLPVTGQPLPLVSYGGTAMLGTYLMLGLVLNVSSSVQILSEEGFTPKQTIQEINDIA